MLGLKAEAHPYLVQPEKPIVFAPSPGYHVYEEEKMWVRWESLIAHDGFFWIEVYATSDCSGQPTYRNGWFQGVSYGPNAFWFEFSIGVWTDGHKSYRVKPYIHGGCDTTPAWSTCRDFHAHQITREKAEDENERTCGQICDNTCPNGGCPLYCSAQCFEQCLCDSPNQTFPNGGLGPIHNPLCCTNYGFVAEPREDGLYSCKCESEEGH